MNSIDFTQVELQQLITHHIGNKLRDEKYLLSSEATIFEDETKHFLLKYFLLSLKTEELYSFTHSVKLELNAVYSVIKNIFSNPEKFILLSQDIGKLLYEQSMHPKVKQGELNIVYFTNAILGSEVIDAIGIFKSETDIPFIKMVNEKSRFNINLDYGFDINGMDKGCIIFNTNHQEGYKLLVIDKANKTIEAQYWKDDFLKVKPIMNEFHQTNQFLSLTKNFVTKQLSEEFEISKTDQIDLLNRSIQYFKERENFDIDGFASEVISNELGIESFKKFKKNYEEEFDIDIEDSFLISNTAVKKQARVFKSVLKLDKNFHIYIHGDKELIEKGYDEEMKMSYYKVYFIEEN